MDILKTLSGGDRRSIGKAEQVVEYVLDDASRLALLIEGLSHEDDVVRMRCADVAEKVSNKHPEWLHPFKQQLIDIASRSDQQEVRWHLAQIFPRLDLSKSEKQVAIAILFDYLEDKSRIVKTFSMTALAAFALDDVGLRKTLIPVLEKNIATGSPAMKSRGRKLLARLGKNKKEI